MTNNLWLLMINCCILQLGFNYQSADKNNGCQSYIYHSEFGYISVKTCSDTLYYYEKSSDLPVMGDTLMFKRGGNKLLIIKSKSGIFDFKKIYYRDEQKSIILKYSNHDRKLINRKKIKLLKVEVD